MTRDEAAAKYGPIVNGKWADEAKHCQVYLVPAAIASVWKNSTTGNPCSRIYSNRDLAPVLDRAFRAIISAGRASELKTFDGCYMIRDVRGMPGRLSAHSYALAIDINAKENPLGGPSKLSPELVQLFKSAGLTWGGDFQRCDPMHFSLVPW